jgi:hypothetical protein
MSAFTPETFFLLGSVFFSLRHVTILGGLSASVRQAPALALFQPFCEQSACHGSASLRATAFLGQIPHMDPRLHAPAAARNRQAILDVLTSVLPSVGTVLEIASGTGEHMVFFAGRVRHLTWQPSDVSDESLASIAAHAGDWRLPNVLLPPLRLDAAAPAWPTLDVATIVCINMLHIAPWAAWIGLVRHAGQLLKAGQALLLYGPFFQDGVEAAESNQLFDQALRRRNPDWGVRQLTEVVKVAEAGGFRLGKVVAMPANNLTVVFFRV